MNPMYLPNIPTENIAIIVIHIASPGVSQTQGIDLREDIGVSKKRVTTGNTVVFTPTLAINVYSQNLA